MMDQLQQNIDSEKIDGQPDTGSLSSSTLPATEIKKRICALVFDSPARDSDDYIRAVVRQENNRWLFWLKNTTPYAVRMSIGNSKKADYFSEFTTLTLPLMIFGHENDCVLPEEAYRPMIEERLRLHPHGRHSMRRRDPDTCHLTMTTPTATRRLCLILTKMVPRR